MGMVPGFGRPGRNGPAPQQQSVAGIDRGLKANLDPNRGRPRKTVDPAALFVNALEDGPFTRDYRDAKHVQPHAMYIKDVSTFEGACHLLQLSPQQFSNADASTI